ncbi:hypothetical protein HWV54_05710 [Bartonella alsatica]|uniref:Uncharacterized protein n=2 Tax=Bartonella alsatica TaxID=52764 RepID=J0YL29_9HYPH|nr:hypothetical protein [Bartonella alsatica]EJF75283.1 hypothetical protein MEC_00759 [Bartonella alsatica IBS 382]QLC52347.1 hypothetical protein HWV54_05710 [Bartonella alsatica]
MAKVFKNYVFNIFIVVTFSLSQVVNVNANQLRNSTQKDSISISVTEHTREKATNMTAISLPNLTYQANNNTTSEAKIENVLLEPITLGTFGAGILAGYGTSVVGMFLGWIIKTIVEAFQ